MSRQPEKFDLLRSAGYAYNFDRMMYINRQSKKAFSVEYVEDRQEAEIASKIEEPTGGQEWRFYTSMPMAEGIERELKRVLQ